MHGSLWAPPNSYIVCRNANSQGEDTYKLYVDHACGKHKNSRGKHWEDVPGAVFAAYTEPVSGHKFQHFCYAGNKEREAQKISRSKCAGTSKGTQWKSEKLLYVRDITSGPF